MICRCEVCNRPVDCNERQCDICRYQDTEDDD